MSTAGIFDEEECTLTAHSQSTDDRKTHKRTDSEIHKYSALWQVTWERIDCFLPNLRQELFTPRSQSPAANIAQVKTEPEKVTAEEPRPAAPELPGVPVEGTIPYFTVLKSSGSVPGNFVSLNVQFLLETFLRHSTECLLFIVFSSLQINWKKQTNQILSGVPHLSGREAVASHHLRVGDNSRSVWYYSPRYLHLPTGAALQQASVL